MNLQQYIFQLHNIGQTFNPKLFALISGEGKAVENLTARIVKRVRDTGKSADGSDFKPYSTKNMLIGSSSFLNKSGANSFFKSKETQWVTVKGHHLAVVVGGYKKFREMNGRKADHKYFEWTSQMWKDFGVKLKTVNEEGLTFKQKGSSEQYKLNYNSEREKKSIIEPSKYELEQFMKEVNVEVVKLLTIK